MLLKQNKNEKIVPFSFLLFFFFLIYQLSLPTPFILPIRGFFKKLIHFNWRIIFYDIVVAFAIH